jgi:hypothetical protein
MKTLNQLQKNYLTDLLDFVHDYKTFDDIGWEGQKALMYMYRNFVDTSTNYEDLVNLVNRFITKYRKRKEGNNE